MGVVPQRFSNRALGEMGKKREKGVGGKIRETVQGLWTRLCYYGIDWLPEPYAALITTAFQQKTSGR